MHFLIKRGSGPSNGEAWEWAKQRPSTKVSDCKARVPSEANMGTKEMRSHNTFLSFIDGTWYDWRKRPDAVVFAVLFVNSEFT